MQPSSVRVEIFDHAYNLRGTDAEYIQRLAEYVDGKMRAVAQQSSTVDSARLAVLAAMNIADELHALMRKYDGVAQDYNARLHRLSDALDAALEPARMAG